MSRSNIAGGKNWLTKACLICSQVVITHRLSSLNHILASSTRDDGKSLIASALVLPYWNIPKILTNSEISTATIAASGVGATAWLSRCKRRYKKKFWAAQKISSRAAKTASRAASGELVFVRDESAGSDGQPGGWLVPVERKL
ncbi:hypothetical protein Tco_1541889 [Tanacetum coccineum]